MALFTYIIPFLFQKWGITIWLIHSMIWFLCVRIVMLCYIEKTHLWQLWN